MKQSVLAVMLVCTTAGMAVAADFPRAPATYYPGLQADRWTGFYAGLNVGYQWGSVTNSSVDPRGAAGGGQVGYNWQMDRFVIGAETDLQVSAADDTFAPYKFSNPWFGTLRGRLGFAVNSTALLYGTLGLAYGDLKGEFFGTEESKTLLGWSGGVGMEVGFTPNWSAKVEYLYVDLGSRAYTITGVDNGLQSSYLRFGINYRFWPN
ncbi:MAG TPA: outer membrane protein [Pseudolabrys sp.]|nr:outer membrane protein [Pseudolabrys sp.]